MYWRILCRKVLRRQASVTVNIFLPPDPHARCVYTAGYQACPLRREDKVTMRPWVDFIRSKFVCSNYHAIV